MKYALTLALLLAILPLAGCAGSPNDKLTAGRVPAASTEVPPPPPRQLVAIDPRLQSAAKLELQAAFASTEPMIRAHALEGMRQSLGPAAATQVVQGLSDRSELVRFAAAMAAGELKLPATLAKLQGMLDDPNPSVRVAVRFALHRLGDMSHSHDLEKTAQDVDFHVRYATAQVLGRLGEPSAVKVLYRMRADVEPAVRQAAAESLWLLGDPAGLKDLIGLTVSQHPDDQMVGLLGLAARRDRVVEEHIRPLLKAEADAPPGYEVVQLVGARAMAMVNPDSGPKSSYDLGLVAVLKGAESRDARQRALAALALGEIGRSDTQDVLSKLLKDADPDVRVSAATAILQIGQHPRKVHDQLPPKSSPPAR